MIYVFAALTSFMLVSIGEPRQVGETFQSIVTFRMDGDFRHSCNIEPHPGAVRFEKIDRLLKITFIANRKEYFQSDCNICLKPEHGESESFHIKWERQKDQKNMQ